MANKRIFTVEIDGVVQAIKNVSELKKAQQELEEAFESADFGTEAYANLSRQLQDVNSRLAVIDEATADITGAEKIESFVRLGNGIVGAFSTASIAAEAFGASGEEVEKVNQKLMQTIAVFQGLQAVQEAVGKENKLVTSLINRFSGAQQVAAGATGKLTVAQRLLNFVMRANPIGLIITALGILIGLVAVIANNWDSIRKKFAPVIDFVVAGFNLIMDAGRDFLSMISGGLINDAATAKTISNVEKSIAAIDRLQGVYDQMRARQESNITVLEAEGDRERDVFEARVKLAEKDLELMGERQDELIKLFRLGEREIEIDGEKVKIIDQINANTQKTLELQNQIKILGIQERKRLEDEAKKAAEERLAALKAQLEGIDTLEARLTLEGEIFREQAKMIAAQERINAELVKGKQAQAAVLETNRAAYDQAEERLKQLRALTGEPLIPKIPADAVKPVPVEFVPVADPRTFKDKVAEAVEAAQEVMGTFQTGLDVGTGLADAIIGNIEGAIKRLEGGLEFIREGIQQTEQQIQESAARSDELAGELAGSEGQRREFLIAQIDKERATEAALEKQKAAQAKAEQKRMDEIEKKRKQAAILQKAVDIAQAISRTALAVITALGPPLGPVAGIPFAAAAAATGAIQIATIAAQKYAMGGMLSGPSHREGGIPFTIGGRPGFEAEGGEAIINKRSAALFRDQLSAINSYNGFGKRFEAGGVLPAPAPVFNSQVMVNNDAMLGKLDALTAAVQAIQNPVVDVQEITSSQQRVVQIEQRGKV